jgi:hypothetical protein
MPEPLTDDIKTAFMRLSNALSPENLHCDGEISRSAAKRKETQLKAQWRGLEKRIGRKVDEPEVWQWIVAR